MLKKIKTVKQKKYKDLSETFMKLWAGRLPIPTREYVFHPIRRWRFDVAWPDLKLAVELHGAVFASGRHTRGIGMINDCEKNNSAQLLGWNILVYTGQDLKTKPEQVVSEVEAFLQTKMQ